ncbi:hypothetical protein [Paenibacillus sp. 2TAB26]
MAATKLYRFTGAKQKNRSSKGAVEECRHASVILQGFPLSR